VGVGGELIEYGLVRDVRACLPDVGRAILKAVIFKTRDGSGDTRSNR